MRTVGLIGLRFSMLWAIPVSVLAAGHGVIPMESPGGWVTSDDYPAEAIKNGEGGTTSFRLTIDAGGRVTDCVIMGSSGSQSLDDATCAIVSARARFQPAVDPAGSPQGGSYSSRVNWSLPVQRLDIPPFSTAILQYDVLANGRVASCLFDGWNGSDLAHFCDSVPAMTFAPVTDKNNKSVTKHVVVRQTVEVTDKPAN